MLVLVTGFTPFGKEVVNPSYLAVKNLPSVIEGANIIVREITTDFSRSFEELNALISQYNPDIIINVGQSGNSKAIAIEKVGLNYKIKENVGDADYLIFGGQTAYFATLPVENIVEAIKKADIPVVLSLSAGSYVCNSVLYRLLQQNKRYINGFIHVPYIKEQVVDKPSAPYMELSLMTNAIEIAIKESIIYYATLK
ncbi:MAG: pyroglutamyl-peptidase I [Clostridia bacterium]